MLRNFAWAAFVGFFLVSTAFIVPVSTVQAGHQVTESGGQA